MHLWHNKVCRAALLGMVIACSVAVTVAKGTAKQLDDIVKSDQDANEYRAIELSNNLIALLVHDAMCDKVHEKGTRRCLLVGCSFHGRQGRSLVGP